MDVKANEEGPGKLGIKRKMPAESGRSFRLARIHKLMNSNFADFSWSVEDNGVEVAMITMSIATTDDFQTEQMRELLEYFAECSRSFYLEAGNMLKTKP